MEKSTVYFTRTMAMAGLGSRAYEIVSIDG